MENGASHGRNNSLLYFGGDVDPDHDPGIFHRISDISLQFL